MFCVVVAPNGSYWFLLRLWALFVLVLRDFDGDDVVVAWKTVIL